MDIRPWAAHDEDMQSRRDVIKRTAQIASIALAPQVIRSAAPMVRLPSERGTMQDELYRCRTELEDLTHRLETRTPADTLTRVTALWANLEAVNLPHAELASIKGRTAVLAGVNAVSRGDKANGPHWFDSALRQAQIAGDEELVSYAHARRAVSHLYVSHRAGDAMVDASLANIHATSTEQKGMAHMVHARATAERGQRQLAVKAVESALRCAYATDGTQYPRPDRWTRAQAHLMAGRALCQFGTLAVAVEQHTEAGLREVPADSAHYRAHAWLNLAEVRVRARGYDGAAQAALGVMTPRLAPVHLDRIRALVLQAHQQDPRNAPMRRVRDRLAELANA